MALSDADVAVIKGMLARGDRQSDIAAWFGCNGGRIAEINTGKRGALIAPASERLLPPSGPYTVSVRGALKAREALTALRELIDETLTEVEAWERPE
jgi:hypothetical protein